MSRYSVALLLLLSLALLSFYLWPNSPRLVIGTVRDDRGRIADAQVRIKGDNTFVRTDSHGRFSLQRRVSSSDRVTAWKEGYFIAGVAADTSPLVLNLQRLPGEDNEDYRWIDPRPDPAGRHNCANCHQAIYDEWRQSGHARASTGRRFRNLYEGTDWDGKPNVGWSLLRQNPDGAGVCTSCHAPGVAFGDKAYFDLSVVQGVDRQGVHCDYCHKVSGIETQGQLGITHGRFGLTTLRPHEGQLFFGPLADVDRGEDAFSPLYRSSRYCASCHEGTVFGVHVYSTYSEWLRSPARQAGKQCQDCHMKPTGTLANIAPGHGGSPRDPRTLGNHRMFTGSQEEMLRRCLSISATLSPNLNSLDVTVTMRAHDVGHAVPTGFVDRNLVLTVEALADGQSITLLRGPRLPELAGHGFAGLPGRLFARQLSDFDGRSPAPFWAARPEVTDTRLVPSKVDSAEFRFGPETREVRVRLVYRRFWPATVAEKAWPDDSILVFDNVFAADRLRSPSTPSASK